VREEQVVVVLAVVGYVVLSSSFPFFIHVLSHLKKKLKYTTWVWFVAVLLFLFLYECINLFLSFFFLELKSMIEIG
jgi:hypothetical protein